MNNNLKQEKRMEELKVEKKYYTVDEAAEYLNMSTSTLYKKIWKKVIPHLKPNQKRVFFLKIDLDHYMTKNRVASQDEIEEEASKIETKADSL